MSDTGDLIGVMEEALRVQQEMTETLLQHRGHIAAIELSVLAIAEQLSAAGHLDGRKASDRLLELAGKIEPDRFREKIQEQIEEHAKRLRDLGLPKGPRPPRGSKPKLVK